MGFGGICRKFEEDNFCVIYEYAAYNLEDSQFLRVKYLFDGNILISKNCLMEPEFSRLSKKKRRNFKLAKIPLDEFLKSGEVQIENCRYAFKFLPDGTDLIAYNLCWQLLVIQQIKGELPPQHSFYI